MAMDGKQSCDEQWNKERENPSHLKKVGDNKNNCNDCGTKGAKAVDDQFHFPGRFITQGRSSFTHFLPFWQVTNLPPAICHSELGECEGKKDTYCPDGDQSSYACSK